MMFLQLYIIVNDYAQVFNWFNASRPRSTWAGVRDVTNKEYNRTAIPCYPTMLTVKA